MQYKSSKFHDCSLVCSLISFCLFFPHYPLSLPLQGMCVKTLSEPSKEKVFVNICQSNSVPQPPELSRDELVELLQSEDPSGYRVPMSLGEPHTEMDNSTYIKTNIMGLLRHLKRGNLLFQFEMTLMTNQCTAPTVVIKL